MLELRGDIHEGGGQILRTALALSARTGQAFRLTRIRAGRSQPGLKAQHLAAVHLAQQLCRARLEGDRPGSQTLTFEPGPLQAGDFSIDIGTAGSMTLLLQASFWALAAAEGPSSVRLRGGSDVAWSPPWDYLEQVTLPLYRRLAKIETHSLRRGFFPKGGGEWRFQVFPGEGGAPLELDSPPRWRRVAGRAVASRHLAERRVGERLAERVRQHLEAEVTMEYVNAPCPGAVLVLWAEDGDLRCGASALSAKGKSSEAMADEAVQSLTEQMSALEPVGEHLADQLVPLLAMLGGSMRCQRITPHALANLEVCRAFLGPRVRQSGALLTTLT